MRNSSVFIALPLLAALTAAPEIAVAQDCKTEVAEGAIIGLKLADPASAAKVIGSRSKGDGPVEEQDKSANGDEASALYVRYANHGGSQQLRLFMKEDDVVDSYSAVEVSYVKSNAGTPHLSAPVFATEHGIKLAITEDRLIKVLGTCFTREERSNGGTVLKYVITDPDHAMLKRVKMPSYYAHYVFRNGRLDRFAFGFAPL